MVRLARPVSLLLLWELHVGFPTMITATLPSTPTLQRDAAEQYLKQFWSRRSQCNGHVTIQWLGCNGHNVMVTAQWSRYDAHDAIGHFKVVTIRWPR